MNKSTSEISKSEEHTSSFVIKNGHQCSGSVGHLTPTAAQSISPEPGLSHPSSSQKNSSNDSITATRVKRSPVQKLVSLFRRKKRGRTTAASTNGLDYTADRSAESSPTATLDHRDEDQRNVRRQKLPFSNRKFSEPEIYKYPDNVVKGKEKSKSTSVISSLGKTYPGNGEEKCVQNGLSPKRPIKDTNKINWHSGSSASSTENIKIPDVIQLEREIKNLPGSRKKSPTLHRKFKTRDSSGIQVNGKSKPQKPGTGNDTQKRSQTERTNVEEVKEAAAPSNKIVKSTDEANTKNEEKIVTPKNLLSKSEPVKPQIERHFVKRGQIKQTSFLDYSSTQEVPAPAPSGHHKRTPSGQFSVSKFDKHKNPEAQENKKPDSTTIFTSEKVIRPRMSNYRSSAEIEITPRPKVQLQFDETARGNPARIASKHEKYKAFEPTNALPSQETGHMLGGIDILNKMSPMDRSLSPNSDSDRRYFSSSPDFDSSPPRSNVAQTLPKATVSRHLSLDESQRNLVSPELTFKRTPGPDYSTKWKFMQTDLEDEVIRPSNRKYWKSSPSTVTYKIDAEILESLNAETRKPARQISLDGDGRERSISPFLRGYRIGEQTRNVSLSSILKRSDLTTQKEGGSPVCRSLSASVPENINRRDPSLLQNIISRDKNGRNIDAQDDMKIPYYINSPIESPKRLKSFLPINTGMEFSTPQEMAAHAAILAEQLTQQSRNLSNDLTAMTSQDKNKLLTTTDISRLIRPSEESILQSVRQLQSLLAEEPSELSSPSLIRCMSASPNYFKYPEHSPKIDIGGEKQNSSPETLTKSQIYKTATETDTLRHSETDKTANDPDTSFSTCSGHGSPPSLKQECHE